MNSNIILHKCAGDLGFTVDSVHTNELKNSPLKLLVHCKVFSKNRFKSVDGSYFMEERSDFEFLWRKKKKKKYAGKNADKNICLNRNFKAHSCRSHLR